MANSGNGRGDAVWQGEALATRYLNGVRGAIPLAAEQIDIMLRLARAARPAARAILDLGCGDGILGHALAGAFAANRPAVVLADFSPAMLAAARERVGTPGSAAPQADGLSGNMEEQATATPIAQPGSLSHKGDNGAPHQTAFHFASVDYAKDDWAEGLMTPPLPSHYDVIVSGFSIHHQPDDRKRRVYADLYDLLAPGGIFLNLEHVASSSRWGEEQFESYFIDALHRYHAPRGKSRDQVASDFYHRPDKAANLLTAVETQCDWLREIGFTHVDCFFKVFELALFGGIKESDELRATDGANAESASSDADEYSRGTRI